MNRSIAIIFAFVLSVLTYNVQGENLSSDVIGEGNNYKNTFDRHDIFNHLDIGLNVGTTGIGLDLQVPVTKYLRIRAGADYMPRFNANVDFGLSAYSDEGVLNTNFDRLRDFMKSMSGFDVDQKVEVVGKPTMFNFKFLVDIHPWQDQPWHLTVGFYWGSSKVAKAVNSISEMPSLLAVGMYNRFYDKSMIEDYFVDNPIYGDYYLDPEQADALASKFRNMGRMGIHMGDYEVEKDGKRTTVPYMMEPGSDGLVTANVFVNSFKPYMGIGYKGALAKSKRIKIGFDVGAMMWGGSPKVVTHDGVDLVRDVVNVRGKVGDYVDVIQTFKVYPVLNFTISYNLF